MHPVVIRAFKSSVRYQTCHSVQKNARRTHQANMWAAYAMHPVLIRASKSSVRYQTCHPVIKNARRTHQANIWAAYAMHPVLIRAFKSLVRYQPRHSVQKNARRTHQANMWAALTSIWSCATSHMLTPLLLKRPQDAPGQHVGSLDVSLELCYNAHAHAFASKTPAGRTRPTCRQP